jgi:hypothetical protein
MNKTITLIILLLLLPVVQASYYKDIRTKGQELGSIREIDYYLYNTTNYQYLYYKKSLSEFWEDRTGDCTEIARVKYIMYKSIGYRARISHSCIMINNTCSKHDYVEYYENYTWKTTEQDYFKNPLIRMGRGIW